MTTNQTIDGVPRNLIEHAIEALTRHLDQHAPMQVPPSKADSDLVREELRALLDARACKHDWCQSEISGTPDYCTICGDDKPSARLGGDGDPPEIAPEDLSIYTYRSKPKSGGFDNSPDDGIAILHRPSGIEARHHGERSCHANSQKAMEKLRALIAEKRDSVVVVKCPGDGVGPYRNCRCDRAVQSPQAEKYDDVLLPFLEMMRKELNANANAGKGDRTGWLAMSSDTCLLEIIYHFGKLQASVKRGDGDGMAEYGADVANLCMMLLDICGVINLVRHTEQPAPVAVVLPQRKQVPDFARHPMLNKECSGWNACLDELKRLNNGSVEPALKATFDPGKSLETLAKQVYDSWESQPGFVPWVDGGKSLKQDEARQIASRTFELALANQVGD